MERGYDTFELKHSQLGPVLTAYLCTHMKDLELEEDDVPQCLISRYVVDEGIRCHDFLKIVGVRFNVVCEFCDGEVLKLFDVVLVRDCICFHREAEI